jgi:hypothetical protein
MPLSDDAADLERLDG